MAVRTTVELPESLHDAIKQRADQSGVSMQLLIVRALEQAYAGPALEQPYEKPVKKGFVTGPMITGKGPRGPLYPNDENPHDLIFP
jgi:hypothetical protein